MPAQLDHAGQLAPVLDGAADGLGGRFDDGDQLNVLSSVFPTSGVSARPGIGPR